MLFLISVKGAVSPTEFTTPPEMKKPSNIQILDTSLDPTKEEERRKQTKVALDEYKERFGGLNYKSAYENMFGLLWYTQLPCYDVRGLTSEVKDELSFIKRCYWKEKKINCNAIFQMQPTDRGMCCSFNMKKAEDIFRKSKYTEAVAARQAHDRRNGFESGEKPNWFVRKNEPIAKAGREHGLSLVFDVHSDRVAKASVTDSFRGVPVLIGAKDDFPKLGLTGIRARPGHETSVIVNPLQVHALPEIRRHTPKKRQCFFNDEKQLQTHRNYSQKACIFECEIEFTAKCLTSCRDLDKTCDCSNENSINGINLKINDSCAPWYYPINEGEMDEFCDPWATQKFRKILKEQIPRNQCKHCLEDCTRTVYETSVAYAELQTCDSSTLGSFLCGMDNDEIVPAPWISDVQNEFLSASQGIPWYLDANSSKARFSNIRSKYPEGNVEDGEIFVAKLRKNPTYDAFEKDIGVVHVFFDKDTAPKFEKASRLTDSGFIVQIASSLSFFMGISVLSLLEIIYWFIIRRLERIF